MKKSSSGAYIACLFVSLSSCGNTMSKEKGGYLAPDEFVGQRERNCEISVKHSPPVLNTRVLHCGRHKVRSDLNFGVVEFQGPYGKLPASILVRRYEQPSQAFIFLIHGGPASATYAGSGIGHYRRIPNKLLDAVYDCNVAIIDIAYAGSAERTFYPKYDGQFAIGEIKYIIEKYSDANLNKNIILAESLGAPIAAFAEIDNVPQYLTVPVMSWEDIRKYYENIITKGKIIKENYYMYSIVNEKIIDIKQKEYFFSFFRDSGYHNVNLIDFYDNYDRRKNLKNIIFHSNDGKVPWKNYSNKLGEWGIPYTVINEADHSSIYGVFSDEADEAYQPLYDDICARSGWKEYTNF